MSVRRVATLVLAAMLAGCTVGPDFTKPVVDTPPAWRIDYPQAANVANTRWWEQFGDPVLTELIDSALRENRDLVIAAARVDAYIGTLDTTRAKLYPQADYNLDASRNRASGAGASAPPADTDRYSPGYASLYSSLYQGVLGAKWQLDLFGRVRRQTESAQARVYATEQGRRGVVLSYLGEGAVDVEEQRAVAAERRRRRPHEARRARPRSVGGRCRFSGPEHRSGRESACVRAWTLRPATCDRPNDRR